MTVRHLYLSPGHNFFGRHGLAAGEHPVVEVESVECVAGRGLVGDRFFDHRPDYKGQVTLMAWETLTGLWEELGVPEGGRSPGAVRRNVVTEGVDLAELVGVEFEVQGVVLAGTEEARPCHWMNAAVVPGAEAWLRGRGGLRARIVRGGILRRGA